MESEEEGEVFMDLSNMKETRDLEVSEIVKCAEKQLTIRK